MPIRSSFVFFVSFVVGLIAILFGSGCVSTNVRSSGASLPVDSSSFDDGNLKVELSYDCDGSRCTNVKARFENMTDAPLTLLNQKGALVRAGQKADLRPVDAINDKIVLGPKDSAKVDFGVLATGTRQKMSYVRPENVWCSVKVDPQCKNSKKAEAACAGFARYYYDTYLSTGGWLTFSFPYEKGGSADVLKSPTPVALKIPPAFVPVENSLAPSFASNNGSSVFYKVLCDEKCVCKEVTKKRNFFLDDKMRAEFE